jgi:hypothetical protein
MRTARHRVSTFDTQEYTRSSQGYRHAVTFIDHTTGYPWAAYQKDKDADTFVQTVTRLQAVVKTDLRKTLRYLYIDADLSTLSREFRDHLDEQVIQLRVSPPYQHYKNDKVERVHKRMAVSKQISERLQNRFFGGRSHDALTQSPFVKLQLGL